MTQQHIDPDEVRSEFKSIRTTLDRLTDAISRLSVIEERQIAQAATTKRIFDRIDLTEERLRAIELRHPVSTFGDLEERVRTLENQGHATKHSTSMVDKAVNAIVTAVVVAVIGMVVIPAGLRTSVPHQAPPPQAQAPRT